MRKRTKVLPVGRRDKYIGIRVRVRDVRRIEETTGQTRRMRRK